MALCTSRRLGFVVMPLAALAFAVPGSAAADEPTPDPRMPTTAECEAGFGYVSSDRAGTPRCWWGEFHGQVVDRPERAVRHLLTAPH